jgi:hypothetical protein
MTERVLKTEDHMWWQMLSHLMVPCALCTLAMLVLVLSALACFTGNLGSQDIRDLIFLSHVSVVFHYVRNLVFHI